MKYSKSKELLAGFHVNEMETELAELNFAGEQWAPQKFLVALHSHEDWEFYLQSDGESYWEGEKHVYNLTAGNFFAVPPKIPHKMSRSNSARQHFLYTSINLNIVLERMPNLKHLWQRESIVFVPHGESLLPPFRQLIREVSLRLPQQSLGLRLAIDHLILEASRLLEQEAGGQQPEASPVAIHPAVLRAKELLDHHPNFQWEIKNLAQMSDVSPQHLQKCFTRDVGIPIHEYLLQARIRQAKEMLVQTDLSITELALELGFSSSQHFAAIFKDVTGETAHKFRRSKARL